MHKEAKELSSLQTHTKKDIALLRSRASSEVNASCRATVKKIGRLHVEDGTIVSRSLEQYQGGQSSKLSRETRSGDRRSSGPEDPKRECHIFDVPQCCPNGAKAAAPAAFGLM